VVPAWAGLRRGSLAAAGMRSLAAAGVQAALHFESAFSRTAEVYSNSKLQVEVWEEAAFLLSTRFPAPFEAE